MAGLSPRATSVAPLDQRRVRVEFTDGSAAEVDLLPLLRGPVFKEIRADRAAFAQVRVGAVGGCLEWPGGADLDPEVLYTLATGQGASTSG